MPVRPLLNLIWKTRPISFNEQQHGTSVLTSKRAKQDQPVRSNAKRRVLPFWSPPFPQEAQATLRCRHSSERRFNRANPSLIAKFILRSWELRSSANCGKNRRDRLTRINDDWTEIDHMGSCLGTWRFFDFSLMHRNIKLPKEIKTSRAVRTLSWGHVLKCWAAWTVHLGHILSQTRGRRCVTVATSLECQTGDVLYCTVVLRDWQIRLLRFELRLRSIRSNTDSP